MWQKDYSTRNTAEFLEKGKWFCEDRSHGGRSEKTTQILVYCLRIHKIPISVQFPIFQTEASLRSEGRAGVEVKILQNPHTHSLHIN